MPPNGVGMKFPFGRLLQFEIAEIAAANQCREVARAILLADMAWNIADGEADSAHVRMIGRRSMHDHAVMQRHFSRRQHDIDGFCWIDGVDHCLAPAEKIGPVAAIGMGKSPPMRAWRHANAAIRRDARGHGYPGGQGLGRGQAPIGDVLMPGD